MTDMFTLATLERAIYIARNAHPSLEEITGK